MEAKTSNSFNGVDGNVCNVLGIELRLNEYNHCVCEKT